MLMFAVKARAEPVSRLLLRVATNKTMFYQNGSEASVNYNGLVNHRVVNRRSSVNRQPPESGSRQTASSAKQSPIYGILWKSPRNWRVCAACLPQKGTGDLQGTLWAYFVDSSLRTCRPPPLRRWRPWISLFLLSAPHMRPEHSRAKHEAGLSAGNISC